MLERVSRLLRSDTAGDAGERAELRRLSTLPRRSAAVTTLLGAPLHVADGLSFVWQYEAAVRDESYRFVAGRPDPFIVDCGANVGVTVLYWKRLYPAARVLAFEPDPALFRLLGANVRAFGLADVTLLERAVWISDRELEFWFEGTDGGRLVDAGEAPPGERGTVGAVRLRDYLDCDVDLLKVDIEGAEVDVILDCADRLGRVRALCVEYHSFRNREQRLDELLTVLRRAGYRVHVRPVNVSRQPFVDRVENIGMDLQLDVFAYRI